MPIAKESMLYVRIAASTHRKARVRAIVEGITLSKLVEDALEKYLPSANTTPETETP